MRLSLATALVTLMAAIGAGAVDAATAGKAFINGEHVYLIQDALSPKAVGGQNYIDHWFEERSGVLSPIAGQSNCFSHSSSVVRCVDDRADKLVVEGGAHHNVIDLSGWNGSTVVYAGDGHDNVTGSNRDFVFDEILAGPGHDVVAGGVGNDSLLGGPGNDDLSGGEGEDHLDGGTDADVISGGPGANDRVDYGSRMARIEASLDGQRNDGEAGELDWIKADVESLEGGAGPDLIVGGAGANELWGNAGNDELDGGAHSDRLFGGANDDLIRSHDGVVDDVSCGPGSDRVIADPIDVVDPDCELVDRHPGQPRAVYFDPWEQQTDERGVAELTIRLYGTGPHGGPSSTPVTVSWGTTSGTATAGSDYVSASGTYTIPAWETTGALDPIELIDDALDEPDETFQLVLTTPVSSAGHNVTIMDNDDEPSLSVDDPSGGEANGLMTFTVSLSAPSAKTVMVDYESSESMKNADWEYTAGTLTFHPGETQQQVDVVVNDDTRPEADETLELVLSHPVNATVARERGTGTIIDDDFPLLYIDDVSVAEHPSGQTAVTFTLSLSEPSGGWIEVDAVAVDGTAIAGTDYRFFGRTTVTFAPGDVTATLHGIVYDDAVDENDETFEIVLDDVSGAVVADGTGIGTIVDDDPPPVVSGNTVTLTEGNSGVKTFRFTISLSAASERTVRVEYATIDDAATAPDDYASASGALKFASGETTKTVDVDVVGDTVKEPNELFYLAFVSVKNSLEGAPGEGKILNDD